MEMLLEELDIARVMADGAARIARVYEDTVRDRLTVLAATEARAGGFRVLRQKQARQYDYNENAVPDVLAAARDAGPDAYRIANSAVSVGWKVNKTNLNKLGKFGGAVADAISKLVIPKPERPDKIVIEWRGEE